MDKYKSILGNNLDPKAVAIPCGLRAKTLFNGYNWSIFKYFINIKNYINNVFKK